MQLTNQLQKLSVKESEEQEVLDVYSSKIDNVSDADFIRLVEEVSIGKSCCTK